MGARMAKVLSISSQVVYGHVGNSTAAFVLQRMGHDVLSLPTILLSNRPGYVAIASEILAPQKLNAMLEAIQANGWLEGVDAILTGYLPTAEHVILCERWISTIKALNPAAIYLCDPILGDDHAGIYIREEAALAIRERLVPLADILTPNRFELGWLSGRSIPDTASAVNAARLLKAPAVLVTSAPAATPDMLANILIERDMASATGCARETVHAHGTGDFFAAIFLAHRLNGLTAKEALRAASAAMFDIIAASRGNSELALIETQAQWAKGPPPLAELAMLPEWDAAQ
jgi:pyridoxine kinase